MTSLRVVSCKDSSEFIDRIREYDTYAMNFCYGSLLDYLLALKVQPDALRGSRTPILLAVYRENDLIVTLTNNGTDFAWMMSIPQLHDLADSLDIMPAAMELLAQFLSTTFELDVFTQAVGPDALVDSLLDAWVSVMEKSKGIPFKKLDPFFKSRYCHATLATLSPIPSTAPSGTISRAQPDEVELLIPLVVEFSAHGPQSRSLDDVRKRLNFSLQERNVWVFRVEAQIVGYVLLGRTTPRTIAVRNVFVLPSHRRRGIAEALVRATTRYHLGAQPLGFEGAPDTPPEGGFKEQICLNVADPGAARVYQRCGFMLDATDPSTGQSGWYPSMWAGVQRLDKD